MAVAVAVAFAAAIAFGLSTALMHHSASDAPEDLNRPDRLLAHLFRQPRWILGELASLTGLGLHLWALSLGAIVVVQPLVATGLVFALALRAALDRRFPSAHTLLWSSVCAAGVAVFLVATNSTNASSPVDDARAAQLIAVGGVVAFTAWILSLKAVKRHSGMLLGIAGGVTFGLLAGTLKATTDTFGSIPAVLTDWPFYASCALGLSAFLLNQRMYHQSSLHSSLPALNTLNPIVAVIFGIYCFGERPSSGVPAAVIELTGLVLMLAAIYFLARSDEAIEAVS